MVIDDLYEQDFYVWTQQQAQALRDFGNSEAARGANAIDWNQVAEEIEDMGKSDVRACRSLVVRIIEHFHKLRSGRRAEPRGHWKAEVAAFRRQLSMRLSPSIRAKIAAELEELHVEGACEAERWLALDEPFFDPIDPDRRWTLEQILGEHDDPIG